MSADPLELPLAEGEEQEKVWRIHIPGADLALCLGITLAIFAAYSSVLRFGFVALDDGSYVYDNLHLRDGLIFRNLKWLFLSFDPDNWFPVTRFSLLLDYSLFGSRAGWYHAENVIIHAFAAILLFGFLRRATGVRWPCAFVALVFALHPLHVESVAWIAERKDVLCAFFWFATLWAWLRYTEQPGPIRYMWALVLFSLGLMSKPTIVTLPFLLLLLDVWPFRRKLSWKLVTEKLPFIALSFAVMAITVIAQSEAQTIQPLSASPLPLRFGNAAIAVAAYIADTLWPARLWLPYAYPRNLQAWPVIAATGAIAAVSAIAIRQVRTRPYLAVGWFWFLGTLIPTIGLLQAGLQARADRYMYVPLVGLSIAATWAAAAAVARHPRFRAWAVALGTGACLAMAARTSLQTATWKNSDALYRHAISMDSQNDLAWNYLGLSIQREHPDRVAEAIASYRHAVRIRPESATLHYNLGAALCLANRIEEGMAEYHEALRLDPLSGRIHSGLAAALAKAGRPDEAIGEYETALRLNPRLAGAYNDLGVLVWRIPGRAAEGIRDMEKGVEIDPWSAQAQSNLGQALLSSPGRMEDAIPYLTEAVRLDPGLTVAHLGLAWVLMRVPGREGEGMAHLKAAQRIDSNPTGTVSFK